MAKAKPPLEILTKLSDEKPSLQRPKWFLALSEENRAHMLELRRLIAENEVERPAELTLVEIVRENYGATCGRTALVHWIRRYVKES